MQKESAILAVSRWSSKFGFPYKVITDSGGGLRKDFINQLWEINIRHNLSSAYNSASNSLAERAVRSLKSVLRKSSDKLNELQLAEICFAINSHVSMEGSGSNNERFLGRSVRTRVPNSINTNLNTGELIKKLIENHEHRMTKSKNKTNKITYFPEDRVMIQNIRTKDFLLNGTIESQRTSDDGKIVSYCILTDKGFYTTNSTGSSSGLLGQRMILK